MRGFINKIKGKNDVKKPKRRKRKSKLKYKLIKDKYETYAELERALRTLGVESSELIVGVDFTKSNTWQGGKPYYKKDNLHSLHPYPNPYQQVLKIIAKSLEGFDNDNLIPTYGFGDSQTTNKSVFPFLVDQYGNDTPCHGLDGVLAAYNNIITKVDNEQIVLSGPTNFAPVIEKAIEITRDENSYHILLIICDGAVKNRKETIEAIVKASNYPLSIVCIGVGKGPWDIMEEFDDDIPNREFDNFQFVPFYKIMRRAENKEVEFAKHALQEIPDQYDYISNYIFGYN